MQGVRLLVSLAPQMSHSTHTKPRWVNQNTNLRHCNQYPTLNRSEDLTLRSRESESEGLGFKANVETVRLHTLLLKFLQ